MALFFSGLFLSDPQAVAGNIKVTVIGKGSMCSPVKTSSQIIRSPSTYFKPTSYGGYNRSFINPTPIIVPRPRVTCRVLHSANKLRTFTNSNGWKVEGRLLSINSVNRTARIRTVRGLCYNVPISKFCSSDISFLKSWWNKRNPKKRS